MPSPPHPAGPDPQPADVQPLKVGGIGLGWAGQQHLNAYAAAPGVEILALAGLEEDLRTELAAQHGIPHAVAEWEELLALEELDAVSVAVPTFLHAPITVAALEHGLHVLCEPRELPEVGNPPRRWSLGTP